MGARLANVLVGNVGGSGVSVWCGRLGYRK